MITIEWFPSPRRMRIFAITLACALGLVGSLFWFVDWGIFSGGQGFATVLWSFGTFAFLTCITGTRIGLPAYWAWMCFAFCVSAVLSYLALTLVFLAAVTPLAIIARLTGRDRLNLRARPATSWWHDLDDSRRHDPERQF